MMATRVVTHRRRLAPDRDPEGVSNLLLWSLSLLVETVLLGVLWDRRAYPIFRAYLFLDVISSVALYAIAIDGTGHAYDITWRLVQLILMAPRAAVAMDIYRSMSATRRYWRFADIGGVPLAACAALVFRLAQDTPLRWPWSSLEQVFIAAGTFNVFLALAILTILTAQHRRPLVHTEDFWHGALFTGYLAVTSVCYFGAARFGSASLILMWSALIFYGLRAFLSFAAAPPHPVKEHMVNTWAAEDRS
jgi:hypothetical protein